MENTVNKILEKVKILINIDSENKARFNIELIVQESINYMNRKDFPEELILTVVKYIIEMNTSKETAGLKSMTVGDTKIEYKDVDPNNLIISLKSQLNRFRKVGTIWLIACTMIVWIFTEFKRL